MVFGFVCILVSQLIYILYSTKFPNIPIRDAVAICSPPQSPGIFHYSQVFITDPLSPSDTCCHSQSPTIPSDPTPSTLFPAIYRAAAETPQKLFSEAI